jgi:hypothetical protein
MIGGQNTGSDGCATTYIKVESNERTTAGDDPRKLDIGGTTSAATADTADGGATEAAADDEFTVHIVAPTRVSRIAVLPLELLTTRKVHHREACFQQRPMDRAPEVRAVLPYAAAFWP